MSKYLLAPLLFLSGCFAHIPMHTTEHMNVHWRASYQAAQEEALRTGRPIVVVMTAGEKDGNMCMGGDYLRSAALRDARVAARLNADFVPVWINVRTTAVPPWPFVSDILVTAKLDNNGRVKDLWSRNYYVHTVIVSPDGQTLLNPGASTVASTARSLVFEGDFSYSTIDPGDYLSMLARAERRFHPEEARAAN
jgi:hypothetical protein